MKRLERRQGISKSVIEFSILLCLCISASHWKQIRWLLVGSLCWYKVVWFSYCI